jgi:hypothetical protein
LFCADDTEDVPHHDSEMTKDHAERVFHATLAASEAIFNIVKRTKVIKGIGDDVQAFEVDQISQSDEELIQNYLGVRNMAGTPGNIKPCGRVTLPCHRETDRSPGWLFAGRRSRPSARHRFPREHCSRSGPLGLHEGRNGMRLALCTLNIGFKFIKTITAVQPDYFVFSPQELILTYKPPRPTNRRHPM